jgi:hypothetical protein
MKTTVRLMMLTVLAALLLPGCQKLFDYIKDNPGEAKKYCKVKALKWQRAGEYTSAKVIYNTAGNPLSMLIEGNNGAGVLWDYRFRYDKKNRLSDHIMNLHGAPGVMMWERYSYPSSNKIIDTAFYYSGLITDAVPPNAGNAYQYNVYVFDLDNKGRIYKETQLAADGGVAYETYYTYDAQGNRIADYITYDDKVNPYRTNPVWSLVNREYSVSNTLYTMEHPFHPGNKILAYNEWGLPTKLTSRDAPLFGNHYDTLEIEYQCSK